MTNMHIYYKDFLFSDESELLQLDRIHKLLSTTYWASNRELSTIQKSIKNSLCFGVYKNNRQIGFARCVTDYAVIFWLCDVIIDENYRNLGLGRKLVECVVQHELLKDLRGILTTKNHKELYEQFGFKTQSSFMFKSNKKTMRNV